jgi:hypothetical protein
MKYLALAIIGIIAGNCTSCTFSSNPDGSFSGVVDPKTAASIVTKVLADK